ncbi:MAG TPA: nitroreductase [Novosphingobium sp.]
MNISDAVAGRRSIRAFRDRPVDLAVLRRVLEKAQMAPSGCNFQPWEATLLTGEPLRALQAKMAVAEAQRPGEYVVVPPEIPQNYRDRLAIITERRMAQEGIARDDAAARAASHARNWVGFGAPVLLLCYLPRVMGPPQWSDVGMWLQTIMLLLREEGLDSCAQESLAAHGRLIKDHIGVSDESHVFFCGLAIGYRDNEAPVNHYERSRMALDDVVRFVGFEPAG